jgi:hypothetical protein
MSNFSVVKVIEKIRRKDNNLVMQVAKREAAKVF